MAFSRRVGAGYAKGEAGATNAAVRALLLSILLAFSPALASAQEADADAGADAVPDAEAGAAEGSADTDATETDDALVLRPPSDAPEVRPKVALILSGDPDEGAVAALDQLTALLENGSVVRLPSDPALRRALSGRGTDDGLDEVRAERRRLGLSERRDIPVLTRLGRLAAAAAVVVVRAASDGYEAVVLDVGRGAFFDGALSLPASEEDAQAFLGRRARAAIRAVDVPAVVDAPPPISETEEAAVVASLEAFPPEGAPEAPPPGDPVLLWFEQNWAYIAAGVLLAGGIAFVAVVATDPGAPQPMLRFVPGER